MFKVSLLLFVTLMHTCFASALQDPTRPLGYEKKTLAASYQLQSILLASTRKLAVINGQQLQENQFIKNSGGVQVVKIEPYQVLLQQGDKRWALTLRKSSLVKKTAVRQ